MQKFQKQIDRINTRYDYEKDKIVNQIRDEYIVPYCKLLMLLKMTEPCGFLNKVTISTKW